MADAETKKKLFLFIRERQEKRRYTSLRNIRLFADANDIPRSEMGDALRQMKAKGAIGWNRRHGWFTR